MNAHCKGCVYHHSAGRRHPAPAERKYNDEYRMVQNARGETGEGSK